MKNIILIAPPAAGKGTQSKLISAEYNIPHISTGDLFRDEVASGSMLGRTIQNIMDQGGLIDDDITVNLLRNRISKVDCNNGYILDGYPRNVEQAQIYENLMHDLGRGGEVVLFMDIDKDLALKRTLSRVICSSCGASYNKDVPELSPAIEGFCDKCGHTLTTRHDDTLEVAQARYDTYVAQTAPLINYYQNKGNLKAIKVEEHDTIETVFNKIKSIIG